MNSSRNIRQTVGYFGPRGWQIYQYEDTMANRRVVAALVKERCKTLNSLRVPALVCAGAAAYTA
jgi:hypothetical protein